MDPTDAISMKQPAAMVIVLEIPSTVELLGWLAAQPDRDRAILELRADNTWLREQGAEFQAPVADDVAEFACDTSPAAGHDDGRCGFERMFDRIRYDLTAGDEGQTD